MNGPVLVLFFFLLLTEAGDSPDTVGVGLPGSPPFASGGCVPGSCGHFVGGVCSCWGPEQRRGPGKFHGSLSYGLKPVVGLALQAPSSTWGRRSSARPAPSCSLCPAFWPMGTDPAHPLQELPLVGLGRALLPGPTMSFLLSRLCRVLRFPHGSWLPLWLKTPHQGLWGPRRLSPSYCQHPLKQPVGTSVRKP